MKDNKRLFIFAAYDAQGLIDATLLHYLSCLSGVGDIVLTFDSDIQDTEIDKLKSVKNIKTIINGRHGEYDFGSYKRAYLWALENLKISDYDFVYLVNDSVYGPFYDMDRYFYAMENIGHDAFGMVSKLHNVRPHIQSWFIGTKPCIFTSTWFDNFMKQITKLKDKGEITQLYENGFSELVIQNGHTWDCLYKVFNRGVYNNVQKLYKSGMPFMKKVAFTRNHGGLGRQILYVLDNIEPQLAEKILSSAKSQYGEQQVKWVLTRNSFKITYRNIKHVIYKLFVEGI
jgi:lipopolysaccharide biosynthesis protein